MLKSYADIMNDISSNELYKRLLAYGLFTEKLPPIFSSEAFYAYCATLNKPFANKWRQYIYYESMRNINVPRPLGIPNPMAYQKLCQCLADNWDKLKAHFSSQTVNQEYKISRIHIRKLGKSNSLFSMNYSNWKTDRSPEPDLLIGSRYVVTADISTCFPSIYTHAIPWALIGKKHAKAHSGNKYQLEWYNQIDHLVQNCKNGETHGLLIGPHTSNLLAEVILIVIDKQLYDNGWRYIRNIDDYTCYVDTYEAGQKFLIELREELRNFDLSLNYKKTEIKELPVASAEQWVYKINTVSIMYRNGKLDFIGIRAYLDLAIELMQNNKINTAILNYAIKILAKQELTSNAKEYYIKTIFHLCLIYPYLVPLLDKNVFEKFIDSNKQICNISQKIFKKGLDEKNYELICYALYFAIKYDFVISEVDPEEAINSNSCLFKLFVFLYFKKQDNNAAVKKMKAHAHELALNEDDFNRNWLFVYESLPKSELKDEWKPMKEAGVSFVKYP